jgi:hypothetical protein
LIVVALASVVTLAAAGATVADELPKVTVAVDPSKPRPDPEDTLNLLGRRQWSVYFHVTVSADRTCDRLSYAYRTDDLFDGRLGLDRSYAGRGETFEPAQTADFGTIEGGGGAGDTIVFRVTGICGFGGTDSRSQPVRLRVAIPPRSCDGGPLRVLRLSGHAWREDLRVQNKQVGACCALARVVASAGRRRRGTGAFADVCAERTDRPWSSPRAGDGRR